MSDLTPEHGAVRELMREYGIHKLGDGQALYAKLWAIHGDLDAARLELAASEKALKQTQASLMMARGGGVEWDALLHEGYQNLKKQLSDSEKARREAEQELANLKRSCVMEQPVMPLRADHPMMKAWNAFCETDEFKNALRWTVETKYDDGRPVHDIQREQHAKGAMWLAFTKGMECR